jgi:GNAT superfamily N-acetyltransferase
MTIDYLANHQDSIPQLAAWGYAEWRSIYDELHMTLEDVLTSFQDRARTDGLPLGLVAIIDGAIVGTGSLKKHELALPPELSPSLGGMFVAPRYRNRGIGSALIRRLLDEARRLNLTRLYLWTPSAESLYARHGWVTIERSKFCGDEIAVMKLVLDREC